MKNMTLRLLASILVSSMIFVGACGNDDTSAVETGIVVIGVTDKPDEMISAINVTTTLIEGNVRNSENASDWQTLLDAERTFNLIEIAGVEEILGEVEIPMGTYNQIRMHVKSVVVTLNGQDKEAKIPSGIIRLVKPFEVRASEKTAVTFDFDAEKSVVVTGSNDVVFQPAVKLLVRQGEEPFKAETTARQEEQAEDQNNDGGSDSEAAPMMYGDENDFFLQINMPEQSEVIVETDTIVIAGRTSVDAVVSVGEEFVDVSLDGTFEKVVALKDGVNFIEVIASISSGQQYNQLLTVIYTP